MMNRSVLIGVLLGVGALAACSNDALLGGTAVGVAAGGAYEYSNKQALEDLEDDYEDGRISKEEYERRRKEIEDRSLVY